MIFSTKRMYAIFQKDLKDLSKNMFIGTSIIMPIVLAAFYGRMGVDTIDAYYLIINLAFAAVTAFVQCAMIAEEKEKNTLRGLMLSPASLSEILIGKSLVSFLLTVVTIFICLWFMEYQPANLISIVLAIFLSTIFYIVLGTLLGLVTKSVVEASVVFLPVLFIFGFSSLLLGFTEKYPILEVLKYLPNIQIIDIANKVEQGLAFSEIMSHYAIIGVWVVALSILTVVVYKRRELDD